MAKKTIYKIVKFSDIVKHVCENGYTLFRVNPKYVHAKGQTIEYNFRHAVESDFLSEQDEVEHKECPTSAKGWVLLDEFTASGLLQVYNNLSDEMKEKFDRLPYQVTIDFMWKQVK